MATLAIILVVLQFLAATTLVLSMRYHSIDTIPLTLSTAGILLGIWAITAIGPRRVSISPAVKSHTQLVTAGPYALIRHPMYTALLLACGGLAFMPWHFWKTGVWVVLLVVLIGKAKIEERLLTEHFPEYGNYAKHSWHFLPYLW